MKYINWVLSAMRSFDQWLFPENDTSNFCERCGGVAYDGSCDNCEYNTMDDYYE